MNYLLDTNVVSYLMERRPSIVARVRDIGGPGLLSISAITLAELNYGIRTMPEGRKKARRLDDLEQMLGTGMDVRPFPIEAARAYSEAGSTLKVAGLGFGNYPLTVCIDMLYSSSYELRYETRRSRRGHIYGTWKKVMPRISDQALNCVVYLYPTVEDAEDGLAVGGTGFLVGFISEVHKDTGYMYAITNSHVIRNGATVVRLNTKQGGTDILDLGQANWLHHRDGDDLAICSLQVDPNVHRYTSISPEMFLTKETIKEYDIGPGDDVYMVGRFVYHEGRQRNTPTARFGNIAMMPGEPIKNPIRGAQESFLVETRSLGGYSGSPVFLHVLPNIVRAGKEGYYILGKGGGPWLLGVDWGHLPITETVKPKNPNTEFEDELIVESNSGQMGVVPAWRLRELLYQEEVVEVRKQWDNEITKRQQNTPFVLDSQTRGVEGTGQSEAEADAFTKEDFENALKRVNRRVESPDAEK